MTLADPTGRIVVELRDDPDVHCDRVGAEAQPGWFKDAPGYQRVVIVERLGRTRLPHAPVQGVRYSLKCYGATKQDATALACEVSDSLHDRGHRITAGGVSIFSSLDDGEAAPGKDPDTGQPYESVLVTVGASTALIA